MGPRARIVVAAVACAACAPRLVALGTQQGRDRSSGIAQGKGVTLVATALGPGTGPDVGSLATSFYVFLVNDGPVPLGVSYGSFILVDGTGRVYAALRPGDLLRLLYGGPLSQGRETPGEEALPIAPGPGGFYAPGLSPWVVPDASWGYWGFWPYPDAPVELPDRRIRELVTFGLRPVTLPRGSRTEGYLFLQRLDQRASGQGRLTLRFEARPEGRPPFPLEIPFAIER